MPINGVRLEWEYHTASFPSDLYTHRDMPPSAFISFLGRSKDNQQYIAGGLARTVSSTPPTHRINREPTSAHQLSHGSLKRNTTANTTYWVDHTTWGTHSSLKYKYDCNPVLNWQTSYQGPKRGNKHELESVSTYLS